MRKPHVAARVSPAVQRGPAKAAPSSQPREPSEPSTAESGEALPMTVVFCTSEDEHFPVTQLNLQQGKEGSQRGWLSERMCSFPQQIVFRFEGEVLMSCLRILGHESNIATKVEVHVASLYSQGHSAQDPPSLEGAAFKRLGFLPFISNEKSKFRSRERKTVQMNASAYFLKLVLHANHSNQLNRYNQVGIINVTCLGRMVEPVDAHRDSEITAPIRLGQLRGPALRTPPVSHERVYEAPIAGPVRMSGLPPPVSHMSRMPTGQTEAPFRSQRIVEFDAFYGRRVHELALRKAKAVEQEDYDEAKYCKEQLDILTSFAEKIYDCEAKKVRAIMEEDFDTAKAVKQSMDSLWKQIAARRSPTQQQPNSVARLQAHPPPERKEPPQDINDEGREPSRAVAEEDRLPPIENRGADSKLPYDSQPVQSRYAIMMAQRAQKQTRKEGGEAHDKEASQDPAKGVTNEDGRQEDAKVEEAPPIRHDNTQTPKSTQANKKSNNEKKKKKEKETKKKPEGEDDEEEEQDEEEEEEEAQEEDVAEGEDDHNEGKDDPKAAKGPKKPEEPKQEPDNKAPQPEAAQPGAEPPVEDENDFAAMTYGHKFNLETMEEWERDVYFAIHDEVGRENEEPPAEKVESTTSTLVAELGHSVGEYTAACLFSKRWRLREAALKVITSFFGHHYKRVPAPQCVQTLLRYCDAKGHGLLDPIQTVFTSACAFVAAIATDKIEECPLVSVQVHVAQLLPRMLLRAADLAQKTRDEAMALIFVLAASSIGPERVASSVLAEPLDADKRRIAAPTARTSMARLMVMQQLLQEQRVLSHKGIIASLMSKLIVPSLNHLSREVREQALAVVSCMDVQHGPELLKYSKLLNNGNVRAAFEERLAHPPDADSVPQQPPPRREVEKPHEEPQPPPKQPAKEPPPPEGQAAQPAAATSGAPPPPKG